jgi:hypothetical protein
MPTKRPSRTKKGKAKPSATPIGQAAKPLRKNSGKSATSAGQPVTRKSWIIEGDLPDGSGIIIVGGVRPPSQPTPQPQSKKI